ncbi:hypothetical protein NEUTE1DRAFT_121747 [Neurospora tetrasperma FGSC 2508]|uniref:NmrA-like domain-containing protein n=1 Tax=Neurospora tetrasperma (strain FGSC 2508 / ATCC MYA-4615 / P0657) TaxID=510951 RepID=F8MJL1_NEUT8|nr:uncharacterized protein NEUTE1DRAFT_121747 [Neurospora tetrasperma FGSC 2508]EGO57252.1 hypothetical protein NEUTE1DRAFT_121747 [Neurospora tetrasperma FGSC 2508]EGZ72502.1 NmrA-domain-containing protein [Neurospora tetrasperma FGSC 2509]
MTTKKTITVFGATGLQGGSVAAIFLNDPKLNADWTVRAVTRDVTKESAKQLADQGAQVVAADLNDKSSLRKAVDGAYAVFAVTNYWEKMNKDVEVQQGKNLVDVAAEAGVQHFIWSSVLNIYELSKGKLPNLHHFDSKAEVEDYARLTTSLPSTFFLPGFYMSNFPGPALGLTHHDDDTGKWTFALPTPASSSFFPLFDTADTGKFVKAAVLHREETLGKRLLGATEYLTGDQVVEGFKKVFPKAGATASYYQVPEDVYLDNLKGAGMPDYVAQELLENFLLLGTFGYYGGESLDWTHSLVEDKLTTWEEFIKKTPEWKDLK